MEFYTTKVLVEVTFEHQSNPRIAIDNLVTDHLRFPAIQNVFVLEAESNFRAHENPSSEFTKIQLTKGEQ